jgi:hypothetical protein
MIIHAYVAPLGWYLAEGAGELCTGLFQALQKRALTRALI